jgi:hypothetical protein
MIPKFVMALGFIVAAVLFACGVARADMGNPAGGIGPGLCDYPAICVSGMAGGGVAAMYWFFSDEPTEINGSHRHCEYGGAVTQFTGGLSFLMFSAQVSAPVGGLVGGCSYRCPNNAQAEELMPNPPSMWLSQGRGYNGVKCRSVGDPLPRPDEPGGIVGPPLPPTPAQTGGPVGPVQEVP